MSMQPVDVRHVHNEQRSLGELLSELATETGTLVRQEVQLAKVEVTQKATQAAKDSVLIGAGGALAYAGLLALLAAVALLLSHVVPLWASTLFVGLAAAFGGYMLIQRGVNQLKRVGAAPSQTIQTLKEDKLWLSGQVRLRTKGGRAPTPTRARRRSRTVSTRRRRSALTSSGRVVR